MGLFGLTGIPILMIFFSTIISIELKKWGGIDYIDWHQLIWLNGILVLLYPLTIVVNTAYIFLFSWLKSISFTVYLFFLKVFEVLFVKEIYTFILHYDHHVSISPVNQAILAYVLFIIVELSFYIGFRMYEKNNKKAKKE